MHFKPIYAAGFVASAVWSQSAIAGCASEPPEPVLPSVISLVELDVCTHYAEDNGVLIDDAPEFVAPTGAFGADSVQLVFTPIADADSYEVWMDRNGELEFLESASSTFLGCANAESMCSLIVPSGGGTVTAWVRARSTLCAGPWSEATSFAIHSDARPLLVGPSGTVACGRVTYQWAPLAGASRYTVFVEGNGQNPFLEQTISAAEAGCAEGRRCRLASRTNYPEGSYRFWVRSDLNELWSTAMEFRVGEVRHVELIAPSGTVPSLDVPFTFVPVPGQGHTYRVWIDDGDDDEPFLNRVYTAEEAGCADGEGTCSVGPFEGLTGCNSRFWVQLDAGEWTPAMEFSLAH